MRAKTSGHLARANNKHSEIATPFISRDACVVGLVCCDLTGHELASALIQTGLIETCLLIRLIRMEAI